MAMPTEYVLSESNGNVGISHEYLFSQNYLNIDQRMLLRVVIGEDDIRKLTMCKTPDCCSIILNHSTKIKTSIMPSAI